MNSALLEHAGSTANKRTPRAHRRVALVWLAFTLLFSVQWTGCSLIGLGLGTVVDEMQPMRMTRATQTRLFVVLPGARLAVYRSDGTVLRGTYRGMVADVDSAYALRYSEWCDTAHARFHAPHIGESVHISSSGERSIAEPSGKATFLGFGPGSVHVRWPRSSEPTTVKLDRQHRLQDATGSEFTLEYAQQAREPMPVQAIARIISEGTEHHLDLYAAGIDSIAYGGPNTEYRRAGLVCGVLVDALILGVVAVGSQSASSTSCSPTFGSYVRELPASYRVRSIAPVRGSPSRAERE